jgi:hypothetical protein
MFVGYIFVFLMGVTIGFVLTARVVMDGDPDRTERS